MNPWISLKQPPVKWFSSGSFPLKTRAGAMGLPRSRSIFTLPDAQTEESKEWSKASLATSPASPASLGPGVGFLALGWQFGFVA